MSFGSFDRPFDWAVRQADQEVWPGEGVFFGLSTVIKFPANYSESPFSVIGSGVTCLPQRVSTVSYTHLTLPTIYSV